MLAAKAELAAAQSESGDVLEDSRSAYKDFQAEKIITMSDSKGESIEAMTEAGHTLEKSKRDYKKASERTASEILAQMKSAKDSLKRGQAKSKIDTNKAKKEILAALQKDQLRRKAALRNLKRRNKANLKKAENEASKKKALGKTTDRKRDESIGNFGEGIQDAKGGLESFKDQAADKRSRQKDNATEKPSQRTVLGDEEEGSTVVLTLEEQKQKLYNFGNRIKILKKRIEEKSGNASPELLELGNEYLAAHRFIDSRDDLEKLALLQFANRKDLPLGSYEQAAWAFKIALSFNRSKGETHLTIGKIYDEINDGKNAIMYAKLAHLVFKQGKDKAKIQEAENFIEALSKKYADKTS